MTINSRATVIAGRALQGLGWADVQYSMEPGKNGGRRPLGETCASTWEKNGKTYHTSDCIGFAMWCLGMDRFQQLRFPLYGGWINTDSLVQAADSRASWNGTQRLVARILERPEMGAVVVYPSWRRLGVGPRVPGHIGVCVDDKGTVVHCHGPALRGRAISTGRIEAWTKHKGARILWVNHPLIVE